MKTECIPCLHIHRRRVGSLETANIANLIFGGQTCHGRVVVVVLSQMLVNGKLLAGQRKLVENVVARNFSHAHTEGKEGSDTLHDDMMMRRPSSNKDASSGYGVKDSNRDEPRFKS